MTENTVFNISNKCVSHCIILCFPLTVLVQEGVDNKQWQTMTIGARPSAWDIKVKPQSKREEKTYLNNDANFC